MNEQKGAGVLRNCLVKKEVFQDVDSIWQLLERWTYLPLAIFQAASFINNNGTTIKGYVHLLDGQEQTAIDLLGEDLEDEGWYKSIQTPVAITWPVSLHQIQQKFPLVDIWLSYMSCMAEKYIPACLLPYDGEIDKEKQLAS